MALALACTVLLNVFAVVPAVNRPVALIEPPPLITCHAGVIATTLFCASLATAVNCCVPPVASDAGFGVTVIVATGPAITDTEAAPLMPPLDA